MLRHFRDLHLRIFAVALHLHCFQVARFRAVTVNEGHIYFIALTHIVKAPRKGTELIQAT
ncbi:hypothetical protein JNE25005_37900 [Escherichia coli]